MRFENVFSGIRRFAHLENQNFQLSNQNQPSNFAFTSNDFKFIDEKYETMMVYSLSSSFCYFY